MNVVTYDTFVGLEGAKLDDAAEKILADVSATHIKTHDPVQVDGESAVHTSAYVELSEPKYRVEQYAVVHDEQGLRHHVLVQPGRPEVRARHHQRVGPHDLEMAVLTRHL